MALKKDYSYGSAVGNYWRIIGSNPNSLYSNTVVRVSLYKDKASRDKDDSIYKKIVSFKIPGINHTRETAYAELKKKPEFEGAVDQ